MSLTQYNVPDSDALMQYAETAIETAKASGKNRLCFFSPEDYEKKLKALELRDELSDAIKTGFVGFSLAYQAQVRSESHEIFGAEALLRFESPRRGPVSPDEFVPVLEVSDLICQVGMWVLRTALAQCREWRRLMPDFHISVNMSYAQLANSSIEDDVLLAVRESGLPGSALTIELTESKQLINYPHLNEIIRAWKREGIEISVDDFGTGYSNMSRLSDMEIDEIKIDRCFVCGIERSAYNYRLVSNIVELADSCQMRICCEGVETATELAALENLHPTMYQGFFFSKPVPADEFRRLLLNWNAQVEARGLKLPDEQLATAENCTAPLEAVCAKIILDADEDIYYLSDVDTYELYYLSRAGQRLMNVHDYQGRKCYKVLHGLDAPCKFCNNAHIRSSGFSVWEHQNDYCGRRFLLKDKLVPYNGKRVSQATSERLNFADRIVGYLQTLSTRHDYGEAVIQVLESVGGYYQADRAYLFERNKRLPDHWDNTFEWCGENVTSELANLQKLTPDALRRWLQLFEQNKSVMLYNLDPLRTQSPLEWQTLTMQGIQRLIAVPLLDNGSVLGFVGVDNPRYSIHDDSQMRVLASFLTARILQDRNEQRYQVLLQQNNEDLRSSMSIGFWSMRIDREGPIRMLIGDSVFYDTLGLVDTADAGHCYERWHERIHLGDVAQVDDAFARMNQQQGAISVSFRWQHPDMGEIRPRVSGVCFEETPDYVRLKGYCRIQSSAA